MLGRRILFVSDLFLYYIAKMENFYGACFPKTYISFNDIKFNILQHLIMPDGIETQQVSVKYLPPTICKSPLR